ncbi:MAG: trigger factor [Bacteroidales bacterium]|nr:trigger factor [Bacteroidales bacterium]
MQVQKTDIDQLNAMLTVTVEPVDYQDKVAQQLKDIRRKANIPGFRPGMVPAGLVKKMYGKAVLGEEVNKAINDGIYNYLKEQKLNILGDPLPNEEQTPEIDWDTQDTFSFAFDIALAPEFDAKLNGKNKLTYYEVAVTDEMVQNQVDAYAERFGTYEPADDYQDGDMVKGLLQEVDGEHKKEGAVLMPLYMKDDAQKQLFANAKKGDTVTFNPMKAYGNEAEVASLLGIAKEDAKDLNADFAFTIETITRHQKAAIDAELFAKVYGDNNIADEAAFRETIKQEIKGNFTMDSNYKFGLDAKAAILHKMEKLEFPDAFLKRWVLATNKDLTEDKLNEDYPKMLEELKWHLAKDQLIEAYGIKIEKEDVEAYAKEMTRMQFMQYGLNHVDDAMLTQYAQEMLKKEDQLRGIVERVSENKIYDAVKAAVKLETKEISNEDFSKLFEEK